MHRFYIAPEHWNPDLLTLSESEAHHARDVLRMKRGDKLVLFNGRGREITAEIVDLDAATFDCGNCTRRRSRRFVAGSSSARQFRKGKTWN